MRHKQIDKPGHPVFDVGTSGQFKSIEGTLRCAADCVTSEGGRELHDVVGGHEIKPSLGVLPIVYCIIAGIACIERSNCDHEATFFYNNFPPRVWGEKFASYVTRPSCGYNARKLNVLLLAFIILEVRCQTCSFDIFSLSSRPRAGLATNRVK